MDPQSLKDEIKGEISKHLQKAVYADLLMPENGFEIINLSTVWETWNLKQKTKWFVYNKLPIFKKHSDRVRQVIDERNQQCIDNRSEEEIKEDYYPFCSFEKYPIHLISNPKSILTVDLTIRPKQALEYISISIGIDDVSDSSR
jgi:hypothetical protein